MNKILMFIIIVLLALFIPTIPYDKEVATGVTTIEYKTLYEIIQTKRW